MSNFECKLYGKPITKYDCDELQQGVKYGRLVGDGIPHLMTIEEINEKREACLHCPRYRVDYDFDAIYKVALYWDAKFKDSKTTAMEILDGGLGDDCEKLGFIMDCGNAFTETYGKAAGSLKELQAIIDNVDDIGLLGSLIYSNWRYFNHWAWDGASILEPDNRMWFITALGRLAALVNDDPFMFKGTIKKMKIVSNNICYGPMPEVDDEVEQHLTINNAGRVYFSAYNFGAGFHNHIKNRERKFSIGKEKANELLDIVSAYFKKPFAIPYTTDVGDWELELTNNEGKVFKYKGSLSGTFFMEGVDISENIRQSLEMDDLFVFDGNPDSVEKIIIDFNRVMVIEREKDDIAPKQITWNYAEHLTLDRKTETIEHQQDIGLECKITKRYEVGGGVSGLLDNYSYWDKEDVDDSNNDMEDPKDKKFYKMTIVYKHGDTQVFEGTYDKSGLPRGYDEFIEEVFEFMKFYGDGEVFDKRLYGHKRRAEGEYMYCSVEFENGYKTYYYISDDDSIQVDDYVLVPVGNNSKPSAVQVVDIEYFTEENAPIPVEKTKHIIRKMTDEDFVNEE